MPPIANDTGTLSTPPAPIGILYRSQNNESGFNLKFQEGREPWGFLRWGLRAGGTARFNNRVLDDEHSRKPDSFLCMNLIDASSLVSREKDREREREKSSSRVHQGMFKADWKFKSNIRQVSTVHRTKNLNVPSLRREILGSKIPILRTY